MKKLIEILGKKERHILGVMSGTSLDGIDIALVKLSGSGRHVQINPLEFKSYSMPSQWRKRFQHAFSANTEEICRINYDSGHFFADIIATFCRDVGYASQNLDAIGIHGQTLFHVHNHSTLQTGESEVIAQRFDCVVISDFRSGDIAAGGSGAPLVPYLDQILFREENKNIALQNLGGIGNITFLPAKSEEEIIAFDTGPANAILNEAVEIHTNKEYSFDEDGKFSKPGSTDQRLLDELLNHEYFKRPLPKSTGREEFGKEFVQGLIGRHPEIPITGLLRTFVSLIAYSIKNACDNYLKPLDKLYISGGGAHHPLIIDELKALFGEKKIILLEGIKGITADSKEAIAFALLAHERLNGTPTNIPSVTGAKYRTTLGKLTLPF